MRHFDMHGFNDKGPRLWRINHGIEYAEYTIRVNMRISVSVQDGVKFIITLEVYLTYKKNMFVKFYNMRSFVDNLMLIIVDHQLIL